MSSNVQAPAAALEEATQGQDERVAFTKRNWMGRFLRAEVNYGDFQRIMGRIQTWEQWLPAWAETAKQYELLAETAEKQGARHSAAEAWRRAAMCWHFGKFNWHERVADAEHAQRRLNACFERAMWSLKPPGTKHMNSLWPSADGRDPAPTCRHRAAADRHHHRRARTR